MNIKKDMESGVLFTAIAKYAGIVITLIVTAVLARLLDPELFGIVNIATVFIAFFSVFSDLGIGPAVIQRRDLTDEDLRGLFTISIWLAIALTAAFIVAIFPIYHFYGGSTRLRDILFILSVNLFFNTLNMVPNALLMKDKRFKFAAIRSLAVQTGCGAIAITAALLGAGLYSLTINPVLSSVAIFFINYSQYRIHPAAKPQMETIRKIFNFSFFQFAFQVVNYFSRNLDKLMMGRYMDMTSLGYYDKSYRLMMMPLQNITYVITPVMHPILAQIQTEKERISSAYLRIVKLLAFIGFPLMAAMFFMADDLIYFFFGPQWGPSIPCFKILALTVAPQMILSSSGAIFQASNDTRSMFICGVFSSVLSIAGICIGTFVFKTPEAVATSLCITGLASFLQCYIRLFRHTLKTGWKNFWKTLVKPAVLALILAVVLQGLTFLLKPIENHFICLAIYTIAAGTVSLTFAHLSGEYDIIERINRILCHLRRK